MHLSGAASRGWTGDCDGQARADRGGRLTIGMLEHKILSCTHSDRDEDMQRRGKPCSLALWRAVALLTGVAGRERWWLVG